MARIFIDGFESGGLDLWDNIGSGASVISAPAGMDGSYAGQVATSNAFLEKTLSAAAEYYGAILSKITFSITGSSSICQFKSASTILIDIKRNNTSGKIEAWRGSTLIATGAAVLNLNQVYHLQFRANIHDTTGIVQVKVDGIVDIDFSGDTKPGTETTINTFQIGQTTPNPMTIQFDNVVIDAAAWPGKTNIQAIRPSGAGNSSQWTPSAGANWDCVDEVPASDADNVVTNANDQVDLYAAGNLVGTVDSVVCVQVQARAVKEGVATPQNIAIGVRTGATDYFSSDKIIPTAAKSVFNLWAQNPNTVAAWTKTEVDGVEIGIKSRA
jgi:hypothetical protein